MVVPSLSTDPQRETVQVRYAWGQECVSRRPHVALVKGERKAPQCSPRGRGAGAFRRHLRALARPGDISGREGGIPRHKNVPQSDPVRGAAFSAHFIAWSSARRRSSGSPRLLKFVRCSALSERTAEVLSGSLEPEHPGVQSWGEVRGVPWPLNCPSV